MRARDQTLLHYPVETFNKIVTSGQFQRLKPSGVAGPPILCATHRRHVLEMSVLGYAVCAAVITACEDDPSPKLLQLTDLTDLAQHAVCNKIGNMNVNICVKMSLINPFRPYSCVPIVSKMNSGANTVFFKIDITKPDIANTTLNRSNIRVL